MAMENMELDENALKLIKKCEDKEIATQGMGACQVMLEEMDRGNVDMEFEEMDPNQTYIEMAQNIRAEDVPNVLKMAYRIKGNPDVSPELKNAADKLIRSILPL